MARGSLSVVVATGCIAAATAGARAGVISPRTIASSPASIADGRLWLFATSAILADRPAVASILGFLVVGLVATRVCAPRVVWVAAASGHILSAAIVYAALALVRLVEPAAVAGIWHLPDYGSSAIVAAWLGVIAYRLWVLEHAIASAGLVVISALLGWYFKGTLTVLDTEHAAALAFGVAAIRLEPWLESLRAAYRFRHFARRLAVVIVGASP